MRLNDFRFVRLVVVVMGGGLRFNGVVVGKYIFVVVNRYLYGVFDFLYVDYWVKVVLVCYWVVINGCDDVVVF